MIEPGDYVKWRRKHIWPRSVLGRVAKCDKTKAVIVVSGSSFEVDLEKETLYPVPACIVCDKPVKDPRRKYCSRECFVVGFTSDVDQWVFDTIVDHKRKYDGVSPTTEHMRKVIGIDDETVYAALDRLVAAGRIRYLRPDRRHDFIVVGGKWTYEEEDHASD